MPLYTIDPTTANEIDAMAARRGMSPEALLTELITRAGGLSAQPRMQPTLTDEQIKDMNEHRRQYWAERKEQERREDQES